MPTTTDVLSWALDWAAVGEMVFNQAVANASSLKPMIPWVIAAVVVVATIFFLARKWKSLSKSTMR